MPAVSNDNGRNPSGHQLIEIEAVGIGVAADFDLFAVKLEIVDQHAEGFRTSLGPRSTRELITNLVHALAELTGGGEIGRLTEGQHLLEAARRLGVRQTEIASRLNVSDATVASWRMGRRTPRERHVAELRRLIRELQP